jgi:hypothetical protein
MADSIEINGNPRPESASEQRERNQGIKGKIVRESLLYKGP